ncbi:MAG: hypothetical protein ABI601_11855 [bacterium]
MSYAGPASRTRGSTATRGPNLQGSSRPAGTSARPTDARAIHPEDDEASHETDWQQLAIFGAGLALGIALGAGAALLAAPQSGEETRAVLLGRARRLRRSATRSGRDAWTELGDELRGAARSIRRRRANRAAQRELDREAAAD